MWTKEHRLANHYKYQSGLMMSQAQRLCHRMTYP
uniref:Uncharacterized protein n=1 Tax=Anguilla anguilla TaxID=7936 RepID=A0A0E9SVY1_ANGAN